MRWAIGLLVGFGVMLAVNAWFIWLAVNTPLEIEPSYITEAR